MKLPGMSLLALSVVAAICAASCRDNPETFTEYYPPVIIAVSPQTVTAHVGDSLQFSATIMGGSTRTPPTLAACTISVPTVATVVVNKPASKCVGVALALGTTTLTAQASTGQQVVATIAVVAASAVR